MKGAKLGVFEAAVPDLQWVGTEWRGTCLSCHQPTLRLLVLGPDEIEPTCIHCQPVQILDSVRAALGVTKNGSKPEEVPRAEPAFMPAEATSGAAAMVEGYSAIDLMKLDLPPARFAVPGYICEGLNIFAGGQKFGKSWLALGLCVAVASGGKALGQIDVERGQVLYLALEDNPRRLKSRLGCILGEEKPPKGLDIYHRWPGADAGGIPLLEAWVAKRSKARLIVIDTLGRFRGSRAKNGDIFQQDYDFGARLKRIGDEHQVAILLLHHISKRQCDDPFDAVSGTIAVTGSADATLLMRRQRGRNDATLFVTGRDVEEREMAIEWSPEAYTWTLAGTAEEHARSSERQEVVELLRQQGPMQPAAVSKSLGKNASTIRSLMSRMVARGDLMAEGSLYWVPSE